jgi:hypothetical protein
VRVPLRLCGFAPLREKFQAFEFASRHERLFERGTNLVKRFIGEFDFPAVQEARFHFEPERFA